MAFEGTFSDTRLARAASSASARAHLDRARSFARARRHTVLVRLLRFALPALTVVALASYGVGVRMKFDAGGKGKIDLGAIAISTQNLTMSNPRYEGFNKDGSRFNVTAKTAVQDIKQQGPIDLAVIDGRLVQANDGVITLTAPRGKFDNKANQLELFDDIKIRGDDGLRADLTQATILMKENRVISKQPVAIDMAAGQVRANEMDLLQASKRVTFSDGVMTRLRPQNKPPAGTLAPAAAQAAAPVPQRMIGASDSPVDVASRKLDVDDNKKTAIFTGEVVARQGEATLRAPELQAFYEGAPAAAPGTPPPPSGAAASGKLKRLFVPKDVTLLQGNDRVIADSADFDALRETAVLVGRVEMSSGADRKANSDRADLDSRADTVLLTGNVVVTQDKNILRGSRLFVDRKAGITKLSTPVEAGQPAGRISTQFVQAAPAQPSKAAKPANDASGFVFRTDPNAPINIDSETLDVVDKTKTATFLGAVRAVQGDFTILTPEMIATYSGDAGLTAASTPANGAKRTSAQLTRVRANQKVEVTSTADQSATGDWADFDVKANTVTIGGNVTMKKGTSVAYVPKAIIDMTTGVTYFEKENKVAGPSVSASPTEQRAPYVLPDLPATKDPVKAPTPPAFANDPKACPPGRTCLRIDPKDGIGGTLGSKPTAPKAPAQSWQTEPAAAPSPVPKKRAPSAETSGWTSQ